MTPLNDNAPTLTPTQLRNARKRRARRASSKSVTCSPLTAKNQQNANKNENLRRNSSVSQDRGRVTTVSSTSDPSVRYLSNPAKAPIVREAVSYMESRMSMAAKGKSDDVASAVSSPKLFAVHIGPKYGWRTVSKLAVRRSSSNSGDFGALEIGMFAPGSHDIIPMGYSRLQLSSSKKHRQEGRSGSNGAVGRSVHHPSIDVAIDVVREECRQAGVVPFEDTVRTEAKIDEKTALGKKGVRGIAGKGMLRFLAVNVERSTGRVQVTLVWNGRKERGVLTKLVSALLARGGGGNKKEDAVDLATNVVASPQVTSSFVLHSLWVHYHSGDRHDNSIFGRGDGSGDEWEIFYGEPYVRELLDLRNPRPLSRGRKRQRAEATVMTDNLPKVVLRFPPNVFRQANLDAFTGIVRCIRCRVQRFSKAHSLLPSCVELYGGVGTIGLNIADLTSSLVSSDENPYNVACFDASADECLSTTLRQYVKYVPKNAKEMVASGALADADIIVVDPPRKGLEEEVCETMLALIATKGGKLKPRLLAYVSCGFKAFRKDCEKLIGGGWKLEHAEGFLLFPGADAIETLAFFTLS